MPALRRVLTLVIGTDGAGKSTLCENLLERLPVPAHYRYFGLREAHITFVKRWYEKHGDHGLSARLVLFPLDYALRRRSLPRDGHVLLDRIPGWAMLSENALVRAIFGFVLPRFDIVILCHGDAEVLSARKPERTPAQCQKDSAKWRSVYVRVPAVRKMEIDTTEMVPEEVAARAAAFIVSGAKGET